MWCQDIDEGYSDIYFCIIIQLGKVPSSGVPFSAGLEQLLKCLLGVWVVQLTLAVSYLPLYYSSEDITLMLYFHCLWLMKIISVLMKYFSISHYDYHCICICIAIHTWIIYFNYKKISQQEQHLEINIQLHPFVIGPKATSCNAVFIFIEHLTVKDSCGFDANIHNFLKPFTLLCDTLPN